MTVENKSWPLISKTPLPRPLEQEQWTVRKDESGGEYDGPSKGWIVANGKPLNRDSIGIHHCDKFTAAHNASLRALQEELVAAKLRIKDLEEKEA